MRLHVDSPRVSLDALTHVDSPRVSVDATSRIESSSSDSSGTCSNPFRIFLHQSSSDSVKRYMNPVIQPAALPMHSYKESKPVMIPARQ